MVNHSLKSIESGKYECENEVSMECKSCVFIVRTQYKTYLFLERF